MPDATDSSGDAVAPAGSATGGGRLVALPLAPERPPDNLTLQLTSFVGRDKEVAMVKELLAGQRLITLTGPGGCGKTRLALRVAQDLVEGFADGVWLVELASLVEADG